LDFTKYKIEYEPSSRVKKLFLQKIKSEMATLTTTISHIQNIYTDFLNFIYLQADNNESKNEVKYFKTIHCKQKSILHMKLKYNQLFQFFYDGEKNLITKTNFHIKKLPSDLQDFYIVGELTQDMHQNKIFLIDDFVCANYDQHNIKTIDSRMSILINIIENIHSSCLDPFLLQIKVIYPYELQMIDVFFKTILISMNTSMDGIVLMNNYGNIIETIDCKNRVELNYDSLEEFLQKIPNLLIVNHVEDLVVTNLRPNVNYKHKDEKTFYSVKDETLPDIYYLFESELEYRENCKIKNIAMIPSLRLSEYMINKNNHFYQKYYFHEYHQKWIPLMTFP
jgi:hypothetical protein